MRFKLTLLLIATAFIAVSYTPARATWSGQFGFAGPAAPVNGEVHEFWVDGSDLYVVGSFTMIDGVPANHIARWNGTAWSAVGNPVFANVHSSTVALYAVTGHQGAIVVAGEFTEINGQAGDVAVWNGMTWSPLGNDPLYTGGNDDILDLVSDGTNIFIAGRFADMVAVYDGVTTVPLVSSADNSCCIPPQVYSIDIWNGDLVVAGAFTEIDGMQIRNVGRWDGTQWYALGSGFSIISPEIFVDNGNLYAMTRLDVLHFDGSTWTSVTGELAGCVYLTNASMDALFFQGKLYRTGAGEVYQTTQDLYGVAKWTQSSWNDMDGGLGAGCSGSSNTTGGPMVEYNGRLVIGGEFSSAGGMAAQNLAVWAGKSWHANSPDDRVRAIATQGGDVFVGGDFATALDSPAAHVARYDGASWYALQDGVDGIVRAMVVIGSDLYVGGEFTNAGGSPAKYLARWNGTSWSAVSADFAPVSGAVYALATDGTNLYVGGQFITVAQSTVLRNVAKWDGASWHALGSGITNGTVRALATSGPDLYVAGDFSQADFFLLGNAVRWDGASWNSLDLGMNDRVTSLAVHDGTIYAGGDFTAALGGATVNHVARWSAGAWEPVEATPPHGVNGPVRGLAASSEGVIVVGAFTTAGGAPANRIARWSGTQWLTYDTGLNKAADAVLADGGTVWVGGEFEQAGDENSRHIARWNQSPTAIGDIPVAAATLLAAPFPNPFNPTTQIRYHVDRPMAVSVAVFDVNGRLIRSLVDDPVATTGTRTISWDGTRGDGRSVASGVYYVRMRAGQRTFSQKLVLLK